MKRNFGLGRMEVICWMWRGVKMYWLWLVNSCYHVTQMSMHLVSVILLWFDFILILLALFLWRNPAKPPKIILASLIKTDRKCLCRHTFSGGHFGENKWTQVRRMPSFPQKTFSWRYSCCSYQLVERLCFDTYWRIVERLCIIINRRIIERLCFIMYWRIIERLCIIIYWGIIEWLCFVIYWRFIERLCFIMYWRIIERLIMYHHLLKNHWKVMFCHLLKIQWKVMFCHLLKNHWKVML